MLALNFDCALMRHLKPTGHASVMLQLDGRFKVLKFVCHSSIRAQHDSVSEFSVGRWVAVCKQKHLRPLGWSHWDCQSCRWVEPSA